MRTLASTYLTDQPNDHRLKAVELSVRDIAMTLQTGLGQALVSVIVGKDIKTIGRWAHGIVQPPYASERLLRDTFRVFELLRAAEDSEVARAWFMGMNDFLDDDSPTEALAGGRAKEVMAAARAFLTSSLS